jgi:hypothetical protein
MQQIFFETQYGKFSGYSNNYYFFAAQAANIDEQKSKKIDVTKIPLDLILSPEARCLVFPSDLNGIPLRDMVECARCGSCLGSGYIVCVSCGGKGIKDCTCSCGHSHQVRCIECSGRGKYQCRDCVNEGQPRYIKINNLVVDEKLLVKLLGKSTLGKYIYAAVTPTMLLCKTGIYVMAIMAVAGDVEVAYTVTLEEPWQCPNEHGHCWHVTEDEYETCCWCGKARKSAVHGKMLNSRPIHIGEDFVF